MTYGPIDFLALEFNTDQLKGEIIPELLELVQNKIIRVIDLVVIQKYPDGHHEAVEMQQLSKDLLGVFDPMNAQATGIIQVEDIADVAEKMENNTTAAAMLFENLWAIKFKDAVLRANGKLITQLRIPNEVVEEVVAVIGTGSSSS
jgi:nitrogenase molybdenum-iron protein alpha/beta subunit